MTIFVKNQSNITSKITLPEAIFDTFINFKLRVRFDFRVTLHRDGSGRDMRGAKGISLERRFDKYNKLLNQSIMIYSFF